MGAGIVMLREGFEASLIVGIVLAFLNRTGRREGFAAVWAGVAAAVVLSAGVAAVLFLVGAELSGRAELVWEGTTMLAAAGLLTWMIFWMRRQARTIRKELETQVQHALATGSAVTLALVAFVGVLREGVETSLFMVTTFQGANVAVQTAGALVGALLAVALGVAFYKGASRLDLHRFFSITSGLLLVFAGYLLARGLHEFAEAGILPDSTLLLAASFAALAAPTLWLYFRPARASASA